MIGYSKFVSNIEQNLAGDSVVSSATCFEYVIRQHSNGKVSIDRQTTNFSNIEEAKQQIKQLRLEENIKRQVENQVYEDITESKIAEIIKKHHGDIKITDTLIEKYIELASSKSFTTDTVVLEIRDLNKLDKQLENKIQYILEDNSTVFIDRISQSTINNIFGNHPDVIDYMKQNSSNFINVVSMLEE